MNTAALRALDLFDRFVVLTGPARDRALAELALQDGEVHQILVRMLASDTALADGGMVEDAFRAIPERLVFQQWDHTYDTADMRLGQRLGPWRITRILGAGGMGTVYEAERDDGQYQQRVALKCIRHDRFLPRVIEGFWRERDILARLEHPSIVPLLDGGTDADGHPWFAMRYVEGAPIDVWCDHRRASVRERVELLVQVCEALQHAHAHGVLHQDIKPSNLLVTDAGQVQLLDFGLGVLLSTAVSTQRLAISHAYAAPESTTQALPTVSGDIWSLGMVMYRMLAGSLPRTRSHLMDLAGGGSGEGRTASLSQLAAAASDGDAQCRGCRTADALAQRLAGDLDAIALRCIAAAPDHRYDAVSSLQADLCAWLDARPVNARKGGWRYRVGRFVARHRLAAGLACLAGLVLAAGMAAIVWERRASAQATKATQMMSTVFEQSLGTATLSGLGETPLSSRHLLQQTEQRVRGLDLDDHPDVLARGLSVLARNHAVLGDYARAAALAREATTLLGDDALAARTQAELAALLNLQGEPAEAASVAQAALQASEPDASQTRQRLLTELARARWHLAAHAQAMALLDEALEIARRADDAAAQTELLTQRAQWNIRLQRFAEAGKDAQHAVALATPAHPLLAAEARRIVALNLMAQERVPEARATTERLLADYRALLGEAHPLVGRAWRVVAGMQCGAGEFDACRASLDRAETIIVQQYGDQHPEYAELLQVRALLLGMADRQRAESVQLLRRAETLLRAAYPDNHNAVQHVRFMIARRLLYWPEVSTGSREQRLDEVVGRLDAVQASFARSGLPARPLDRITLSDALVERGASGDLARARRLLDQNTATLRAFPPTYSLYFRNDYERVRLAYIAGDADAADRIAHSLAARLETYLSDLAASGTRSALSDDNNRRTLSDVYTLQAALLARRGDQAQARRLLQNALDNLRLAKGYDGGMLQRAGERLAALDRSGTVEID
jgi:hypothetical protein